MVYVGRDIALHIPQVAVAIALTDVEGEAFPVTQYRLYIAAYEITTFGDCAKAGSK